MFGGLADERRAVAAGGECGAPNPDPNCGVRSRPLRVSGPLSGCGPRTLDQVSSDGPRARDLDCPLAPTDQRTAVLCGRNLQLRSCGRASRCYRVPGTNVEQDSPDQQPAQVVEVARVANLMSVVEVACVLGISDRKVRRLIWRGELHSVRIGDRVLVTVDDLRAFIESTGVEIKSSASSSGPSLPRLVFLAPNAAPP